MKPKQTASKRTKERFKEHEPFKVVLTGNPDCFSNECCLLLWSVNNKWFGWIPKNEIDFN